jgi:hypothetical protein
VNIWQIIRGVPVKTDIVRIILATASVSLAGTTYAMGLDDVLPAASIGLWHAPEAVVLALQGVVLFVLASAVRRQRRSASGVAAVPAPPRVRLPLAGAIRSVLVGLK